MSVGECPPEHQPRLFAKHFPEYGSDFMAADIDEKAIRHDDPKEMVKLIAAAKADEIVKKLSLKEKDVVLPTCDQVWTNFTCTICILTKFLNASYRSWSWCRKSETKFKQCMTLKLKPNFQLGRIHMYVSYYTPKE